MPKRPRHVLASATAASVILIGAMSLLARALSDRFERVVIEGKSMEPTFLAGDRLVVWKSRSVRPGNVIALADPRDSSRSILKRVRRVEGDMIFVVGDNQDHSTDSLHFGSVPTSAARGRVVYRYFPAGRAGKTQCFEQVISSDEV